MRIQIVVGILVMFTLWGCNGKVAQNAENTVANQQDTLVARLDQMLAFPVDSVGFPRSGLGNEVRKTPSKDWTSGFFPGSLMYAYQLTGNTRYLERAIEWLPHIEKEKYNGRTHDMGFKVNCSYGKAYQIDPKPAYKAVMLHSANTLITRYNETVGCIKSWDFGRDRWQFPVIIDNMMNLELLFEATILSGDSTYHNIAVSHANHTLANHFRADNSSDHVVDYDTLTGEVVKKLTHQGHNDSSAWARGQAWGLYGFTMCYRYTQDKAYLAQAQKIADFILSHPKLPNDLVPYWDYNAPEIPNTNRDASAAAITASALIELSKYVPDANYMDKAQSIVTNLSSAKYVLNGSKLPFILGESTGNAPKDDEMGHALSYADYYYLEALHRLKDS